MTSPGKQTPLIGSVILAGGFSRRMGRPKALLPLRGSTFIETIAASYRDAGISSILAVTYRDLARQSGFPRLCGVDLLVLDVPTDSPLETLRHAIDRIGSEWDAFFLHPVDHPFVECETMRSMARVYMKTNAAIIQPRHNGKGGHPVLISTDLGCEIRAASLDQGLRQVIRAEPERVHRLEVKDRGILDGINTPSDLAGRPEIGPSRNE